MSPSTGNWLKAALLAALVLVTVGKAAQPEEGAIAFVRADQAQPELGGPLYVIGADGQGLTKLIDLPVQHPAWSPDGRQIVFSHECAIWVARADGSDLKRVTGGTRCAATPAWSPDGRRLAFSDVFRRSGVRVSAAVAVVNVDGSGLRHVSRRDDGLFIDDAAPTWSPDGSRLTFQSSSIFPAGFRHLARGYVVSQIVTTTSREGYYAPGPATSPFDIDPTADWVADSAPAWAPDGKRLVFQRTFMRSTDPSRSVETVLYLVDRAGRSETRFISNAAWPAWSPTGRNVVFTALEGTGPRARGLGLTIADEHGSIERRLTSNPGDEWATWAPGP